jgi:L-ribulose-5-phosphate 3-epimerase
MKRELKKGIWYPSLPGKTALDKFKAAKEAGFEGVEMPSHLDQDDVVRARDETGVMIATVSPGQHSRMLSLPDPAKRAEGVEGLKQALRDAKRYGATSLLVVPGIVNEKISYDAAYARVQTEVKKVVPLAEELGVQLGFENVWNYFILSPIEAVRFVDEFKSPLVGWHFDVGNMIFLGWPEQWIRILGKRIFKLHIKEYSRKKLNEGGMRAGFAVEYLEGDCDWPAVMKALGEISYKGWATAEPAWKPEGVAPQTRLKQISEKLDEILAK